MYRKSITIGTGISTNVNFSTTKFNPQAKTTNTSAGWGNFLGQMDIQFESSRIKESVED